MLPAVWARLNDICHELEVLFGDAQDFEFTVQSGVLFLLQTRRAKRTDWAALAIAVDMVEEGALTPTEALARLHGIDLEAVVRTSFALWVPETLAVAQVASMGVASGAIALDPDAVKRLSAAGTSAILVRRDTVTTDTEGMSLAAGILTASGGRTSHAAVVAPALARRALSPVQGWTLTLDHRQCRIGGRSWPRAIFYRSMAIPAPVHFGRLAPLTERPERALAAVAVWRHAAAPL